MIGGTKMFISLHKSMPRLNWFFVAFLGGSTHPQLVSLTAHEEITRGSGQVEPPGMHMIYFPYCDDIRNPKEVHIYIAFKAPLASDEQIKTAPQLMKRVDLKDFSVCQFSNTDDTQNGYSKLLAYSKLSWLFMDFSVSIGVSMCVDIYFGEGRLIHAVDTLTGSRIMVITLGSTSSEKE